MLRALLILGTRPEAIKLSPLVRAMRSAADFEAKVCSTGQHREMLDQVLSIFNIKPDYELSVMTPGQPLALSTSNIMAALGPVMENCRPDCVIVQGDTTTAFCGALSGFYCGVPVAHVEAGLRTWDMRQPFPEEMNRVLVTRLAALHFAPTTQAAENLRAEGVPESSVWVTGNTGIDAVLHVRDGLERGELHGAHHLAVGKKLVLVTAHRRENFGSRMESICRALVRIAQRSDAEIVYPVHLNPNVRGPVEDHLAGVPGVKLIPPVDYVSFVDLMRQAHIILTDSGGIQEEAPSLGKPVLVLRDKTERPEAVEAGTVRLVGTSEDGIVAEVERLLDDGDAYRAMVRVHSPYGDGHASERITDLIRVHFRG
ncbi:MAG: UDP-N-acetylglucosamine 2-epimerase (non-hydrolyzing) [Bryobacteraceae bacterium]|nr:UDP-N-acetylglucosamine 2-epimerase (non-hydrolyzing) [Bryobacteraceae bacterium]